MVRKIKVEQEEGRLSAGGNPHKDVNGGNNNNLRTLTDYGLDKEDSRHAQALAEHKDIKRSALLDSEVYEGDSIL